MSEDESAPDTVGVMILRGDFCRAPTQQSELSDLRDTEKTV